MRCAGLSSSWQPQAVADLLAEAPRGPSHPRRATLPHQGIWCPALPWCPQNCLVVVKATCSIEPAAEAQTLRPVPKAEVPSWLPKEIQPKTLKITVTKFNSARDKHAPLHRCCTHTKFTSLTCSGLKHVIRWCNSWMIKPYRGTNPQPFVRITDSYSKTLSLMRHKHIAKCYGAVSCVASSRNMTFPL